MMMMNYKSCNITPKEPDLKECKKKKDRIQAFQMYEAGL
jgi:hypothetical protein